MVAEPNVRNGRGRVFPTRDFAWRGLAAAAIIAAGFTALFRVWLSPAEAWMHPELEDLSALVWSNPSGEGLGDRLHHILEMREPPRVRIVNEAAQVVDAIARPYLVQLLPPHPSLTPVGLLSAILVALLTYLYLRRYVGLPAIAAAGLVVLSICSIGFLSSFVSYIRPAKKLTMLLFPLLIYLAALHRKSGKPVWYWLMMALLFLSFFSDEEDLANYATLALLFAATLLRRWWQRLAFLAVPVVSFVSAQYLAKAVYGSILPQTESDIGAAAAFFANVANPDFVRSSASTLAGAVLTTVGFIQQSGAMEAAAIAVMAAVVLAVAVRDWRHGAISVDAWNMMAAALALVLASALCTILDWQPKPAPLETSDRAYLGQFTYYYHASLTPLIVLWLAFVAKYLLSWIGPRRRDAAAIVITIGCLLTSWRGLQAFHEVNRLTEIIHSYPYDFVQGNQRVLEAATLPHRTDDTLLINFVREPDALEAEFEAVHARAFGASGGGAPAGFLNAFHRMQANNATTQQRLAGMMRGYFPWNRVLVSSSTATDDRPPQWVEPNSYAAAQRVRQQSVDGEALLLELPANDPARQYLAGLPLPVAESGALGSFDNLDRGYEGFWLLRRGGGAGSLDEWLRGHRLALPEQRFGDLSLTRYRPEPTAAPGQLAGGARVERNFGPLRLATARAAFREADHMDVALLWLTTATPNTDYTVSLQLFDPDGHRVAIQDQQPLDGASPTSQWRTDLAYPDAIGLAVDSGPAGVYSLKATVYDRQGQPAGPQQTIASIPRLPEQRSRSSTAVAEAGWTISQVRVGRADSGKLVVAAQGEVSARPQRDYTWFAHLLDSEGHLVAQDDRPPIAPTSAWQPGDAFSEVFAIAAEPQPGWQIELGAYDASGQRTAFQLADGQTADRVLVPAG